MDELRASGNLWSLASIAKSHPYQSQSAPPPFLVLLLALPRPTARVPPAVAPHVQQLFGTTTTTLTDLRQGVPHASLLGGHISKSFQAAETALLARETHVCLQQGLLDLRGRVMSPTIALQHLDKRAATIVKQCSSLNFQRSSHVIDICRSLWVPCDPVRVLTQACNRRIECETTIGRAPTIRTTTQLLKSALNCKLKFSGLYRTAGRSGVGPSARGTGQCRPRGLSWQ